MRNYVVLMAISVTLLFTGEAARSESGGGVAIPQPKPDLQNAGDDQSQVEKPLRVYQAACPAILSGRVTAVRLPRLREGECGERSPLEVSAISKITLSSAAVLNCRMADTVARWLPEVSKLAENILGSPLKRLQTSTSYQCRRRNNAPTGKISEHGFANALDIVGFELQSGQQISVLKDWPLSEPVATGEDDSQSEGPEPTPKSEFLRLAHKAACDRFTAVLGPDSDPHHKDHLHFDLGCHGKRCLYRICE